MNQLAIESIKHNYRRQLLETLLIEDDDEEGIVVHHQNFDLKDCSYMVVQAWSLVKSTILRRAWNKLKSISTKKGV